MQQVTITTRRNDASLIARTTFEVSEAEDLSIDAVAKRINCESCDTNVASIEVFPPALVADHALLPGWLRTAVNIEGNACFTRPTAADLRRAARPYLAQADVLVTPALGDLDDLKSIASAINAAGILVLLEHPGMLVAEAGTFDLVLDTDTEYRIGFYADHGLWKGEDSINGLEEFPLTHTGRGAAIDRFITVWHDLTPAPEPGARCEHGIESDDVCLDCAAEASNALADGIVSDAGTVTHEGITSTIDGTIVAVEGHPVVPAAEDTMSPVERLISELTMDEDGIRTILSSLPEDTSYLDQDTREYIDGILIPMSKRMMRYLRLTAEAVTGHCVIPFDQEDDEDAGDADLEYEDGSHAFSTFAAEIRRMHGRLEVIRGVVIDAQADENEHTGYIEGLLRMAGVTLATLADEADDAA